MTAVNSRSSDIRVIGEARRCRRCPSPLRFRSVFFSPLCRQDRVSYGKNKTTEGRQTHSFIKKPGFCLSETSKERVERAPGSRLKMMGPGASWNVCRCPLLFLLLLGTRFHMLHGQGKSFLLRHLGFQVSNEDA